MPHQRKRERERKRQRKKKMPDLEGDMLDILDEESDDIDRRFSFTD